MLTILIFTSKRNFFLRQIVEDFIHSKKFNLVKIQIVFYGVKSIPKNKFLLKLKKLKNVKIFNEKKNLSGTQKFIKYSKKIKTKFLWVPSDDDRVFRNSLYSLLLLLKNNLNCSGITLPYLSRKKINNKKYYYKKKLTSLRNFDLERDYKMLGLRSAYIFNTKQLKKFFKPKNKKYFTEYVQSNFLINNIANWGVLKKNILIFRYGNLDNKDKENLQNRLDDEFSGYLPNLKDKTKNRYHVFFNNIFFYHIISWLNRNLITNGRIATLKIILKNKKNISFNFKIIMTFIIMLILPSSIRSKLRKISNLRNKFLVK